MLKFHREISVCNCWHIEALNPIRELPARCLHSSRAVRSARIPDPWHAATLHFVPWSGRNRGRWKGEAHNRYMRAQVILSSGTSSHPTLLHTFHTSNTNMFKSLIEYPVHKMSTNALQSTFHYFKGLGKQQPKCLN